MKRFFQILLLALALGVTSASTAVADARVEFILDGSGSMWGQAGGETKIEAAKRAMTDLLKDIELPRESFIGLTVYGHRRKGDCTDIERFSPVSYSDRNQLFPTIEAISPMGKTPIADALFTVGESMKKGESKTSIVLVSDGIESCGKDPCAVARQLRDKYGIEVTIHVVGFDVKAGQEQEQLQCIAKAGGGQFEMAKDATQLVKAFEKVEDRIVKDEPRPEPKSLAVQIGISAIVVEPLTLEGFPKIEEVYVLKPGARMDWGALSPVSRTKQFGKPMTVPPGEYVVAYKVAAGGRRCCPTVLLKNATVEPGETLKVETNEEVSGILVKEMEGVAAGGLYALKAGGRRDKFSVITHGGHSASVDGFGKVLMVTAGRAYDVLLDAGENKPLLPLVEGLEAKPGQLLVLGQ